MGRGADQGRHGAVARSRRRQHRRRRPDRGRRHQRGRTVAAHPQRRRRRRVRHDRHAGFRRRSSPSVAVPDSQPRHHADDDVSAHFTPDDVYAATLVGLLQSLEAGTTTVVDWCDVAGRRRVSRGRLVGSCRRQACARCSSTRTRPGHPATSRSPVRPRVDAADLDADRGMWATARAAGRRIHARAGTTAASHGTVAELGRRGLLGADVTLSDCTHLSDADFDAIAASSTSVVLTPASEMAKGSGSPPMQQLIDRNIRPGWASATRALLPATSSPRCGRPSPPNMPGRSISSWPAREACPTSRGLVT